MNKNKIKKKVKKTLINPTALRVVSRIELVDFGELACTLGHYKKIMLVVSMMIFFLSLCGSCLGRFTNAF